MPIPNGWRIKLNNQEAGCIGCKNRIILCTYLEFYAAEIVAKDIYYENPHIKIQLTYGLCPCINKCPKINQTGN